MEINLLKLCGLRLFFTSGHSAVLSCVALSPWSLSLAHNAGMAKNVYIEAGVWHVTVFMDACALHVNKPLCAMSIISLMC